MVVPRRPRVQLHRPPTLVRPAAARRPSCSTDSASPMALRCRGTRPSSPSTSMS
ncbi:hypothetical protein ZEAMMB73_Zm00001d041643 [Zea mays]|uniref:Uncharacterized protein n=1 Tax=Zea mays TaxID=4577 RepID=A0A1D6MXH3_MAIZE|nr:hypothetical protein ZEAMMB73_Zm00001d041643 [Zea mays]